MGEWIDVYDQNGHATGRIQQRDVVGAESDYYLTVSVWVKDKSGQLLLTKRCSEKRWYPSCWETTGGFAQAGETGYRAAVRELREETGLTPPDACWRLLGEDIYHTIFSNHRYHAISASYLVCLPEIEPPVTIQRDEVADYRWITPERLLDWVEHTTMEPFTPASFQRYRRHLGL